MSKVPGHLTPYLEYVRNAGDGATKGHFMEDWEPIGAMVWAELVEAGRIYLTDAGQAALPP